VEPVKREAFLDWVRRGGTVHLLWEPTANTRFQRRMSLLNSSLIGCGSGRLGVRHAVTQRGATESMLAASGFPPLALKTGQGSTVVYQLPETILRALAGLTRPRHSWGLIYLLTIVYILGGFPEIIFLASGYRITDGDGHLLLAVAGFGCCSLPWTPRPG